MKKFQKLVVTILMGLLFVFSAMGLVACGSNDENKSSNSSTTYYAYTDNGVKIEDDYIMLDGNSWNDGELSGTFTIDDGVYALLYTEGNETLELATATLKDGILKVDFGFGEPYYYYKDGCYKKPNTEPELPSNPGNDSGTTPETPSEPGDNTENPDNNNNPSNTGTSQEYTITYVMGVNNTTTKKTVEKLAQNWTPAKDGYSFDAWYSDENCTIKFDFNTVVTSDITLYAWFIEVLPEGQLQAPKLIQEDTKFSWDAINGSNGYQVVVRANSTIGAIISDETIFETTFEFDTELTAGTYYIQVRAKGNGETTTNSTYSTKIFKYHVLDTTTITYDKTQLLVSWTAVENAEYYTVQVDGSTLVENTTELQCSIASVNAGSHSITVKAVKDGWLTSSISINITKDNLSTPKEFSVQYSLSDEGYVFSWNNVNYAEVYRIYVDGEHYATIDKMTSSSSIKTTYVYKDEFWANGDSTHKISVAAYDNDTVYLLSAKTQELTIEKRYNLTVVSNNDYAGIAGISSHGVKVRFDTNGGKETIPDQIVTAINGLTYPTIIPTSISTTKFFAGWYDNKECTGEPYDFTADISSDLTLYAKWGICSYGDNILTKEEFSYETTTSEKWSYFTALSTGYYKLYYKNSSSSSRTYLSVYDVTDSTTEVSRSYYSNTTWSYKNMYLTAGHVYRVVTNATSSTYKGTFSMYLDYALPTGGGISIYDENNILPNEQVTITAITKTGYTFIGWYDGNGNEVRNDENVLSLSYTFAMPSMDTTYTAKWIKVNIVSENSNAGSVENTLTGKYKVGDTVTITATTNSGYTFVGWYDNDECVGEPCSTSLSCNITMPNINTTYMAKWIKVDIISESSAKGTVSSLTDTYFSGQKDIKATATSNIGYVWVGWYKGDVFITNDLTLNFDMPNDNTVYMAKWIVKEEMSNFTFKSTTNSCTITGIKDKTIKEIVVPKYVTQINKGAFSGCLSLEAITLPFVGGSIKNSSDNYQYPFGYIFGTSSYSGGIKTKQYYYGSSLDSETYETFYLPSQLKKVNITGGNILHNAFASCSLLTNITIPDTATQIGSEAFEYCSALQILVLGNNSQLESIGSCAFKGCNSLTSINIPDNVINIDYGAFYECLELRTVCFGNNSKLEEIGSNAFKGCNSLTSLTLPNNVTNIGSDAFQNCYNLVEIIDKSIALTITAGSSDNGYIGYYALQILNQEPIITNFISSGEYDFYNANGNYYLYRYNGVETQLILPENINNFIYAVNKYVFYKNNKITSVVIPDNVISIGANAFNGCVSLQTLSLGKESQLESIGSYAFESCSSLASIRIPSTVTNIGYYAFNDCYKLVEVINNSGLTITAGEYTSESGGIGLYALQVLEEESQTLNFISSGDYTFYKVAERYYLYSYNGNGKEITLPDNINGSSYAINTYAFSSNDDIISVVIPSGVTSIGESAFFGCESITSITMANSVTTIGEYAFAGCVSLVDITLSNSISAIQHGVFQACSRLSNITIPSSVKVINGYAFAFCDSLSTIEIPMSVNTIRPYAFYGAELTTITFLDTTTWYRVSSYDYNKFLNGKIDGTYISVADAAANADTLTDYYGYYWAKK